MTTCIELPATSAPTLPAAAAGERKDVPPYREVLAFRLGDEEYGLDIMCVQEIRPYTQPTRIATAPPFIKGVINLRGNIVPILDLRLKFNQSNAAYDGTTVTIVVHLQNRMMGLVVDAMSDVVRLNTDQIQPPPQLSSDVEMGHVTGICAIRGGQKERLLILMDIQKLLSSTDMSRITSITH